MFNLDSFAESMKDSVPKKMSFNLDELILIRDCMEIASNVVDYVESFEDVDFDRLDSCIPESLLVLGIDSSSSSEIYNYFYEAIKNLIEKLNSFSFN